MSETKFTPGPWFYRIARLVEGQPPQGFGIFPATERTDLPEGVQQHSLASANLYEHSAFTAFFSPDEIKANAALIAAAPELYGLAGRWLALDAGSWHPERHAREKEKLIEDTRAALAKACAESASPSHPATGAAHD